MGKTTDEPARRGGIRAIDKAVAILRTFDAERPSRRVSEVAHLVGLAPSTAHRLLAALQDHGLVRKTGPEPLYELGSEVLRLAHVARDSMDLITIARPTMTRLRDRTDETVGLHVVSSSGKRIVLAQVESTHPLRGAFTQIGQPAPIHEGAPGKALLAHLPEPARELELSRPLRKRTPSTITDPVALRAELALTRQRGYALSVEERVPGLTSMAVPVRDGDGRVIAALSVSGPSSRIRANRLRALLCPAMEGARELSRLLGHQEASPEEAS